MTLTRRAATVSTLALMAGCATQNTAPPPAPTPVAPRPSAAIGSFGIDMAAMDRSVKPGDDFWLYVNGTWLANTPIPPDRTSWGTNAILADKAEREVREIVNDAAQSGGAPGTNAQKIADFYNAFLNQDAIEAKGLAPTQPVLTEIAALRTHEQVLRFLARADVQLPSPIDIDINLDDGNPDRYLPNVTHGGLGLPDRDYYLRTDAQFVQIRQQYAANIAQMLQLVGQTDTAAKAAAVLDFETKIAQRHWPAADRRERERTYNLMDRAHLRAVAPNFPWDARMDAAGMGAAQEVVVAELSAMKPLADLSLATPVATWKSYLAYHYIHQRATVLPHAIDDADFAFYGHTLNGQPQQRERWKRAISALNTALGEAVGQVYVQRHFPPESKAAVQRLVENMRQAYHDRIQSSTWLSADTKTAALEKLALFRPKIGYPDHWRDYSAFDVRAGDAFGNAQRYQVWEWNRNLARLGRPSDRDEWFMTPHTVNAYYNPPFNEVVFPAAYLQPPLFDANADPAVNYGAIGGVIGHEMGHGFDDQGAKSDGHGVLRNWWTPEDMTRFHGITDRLVAQYDAFEPLPGIHVNGRLTLGENIGDNGGLQAAYHAYRIALNGQEAPALEGTTGDQRFFMARAQARRQNTRDASLRNQLLSDPHSPPIYRVNGIVRNCDAWYAAFNVQPGEKLYLAPNDRVTIW